MASKNSFIFKEMSPLHLDIPAIIALSIGFSNPDKLKKVLIQYEEPSYHLIGCFDADKLVGVIGVEIEATKSTIHHIAIIPEYRLQNIGKMLIKHIIDIFALKNIYVETDDEAVEFYKKIGFISHLVKEKYGIRYKCKYDIE